MVRAWGLLVAILALGCHTTRILAAAEDLGGSEVDDDDNTEALVSSVGMAARKQDSRDYEWCASIVLGLTLAACVSWATLRKSPDSRRDEYEARLLHCRNELRRARKEMKLAETRQNNLVTEVAWWQELHVDELHEKQGLRKELRRFREEIEPGLLAELDRNEKLVKLLGSRLDTTVHPCTTCFPPPSTGGGEGGSGGIDGRDNNVGDTNGDGDSDHSEEGGDADGKLVDQLTQLMLAFPRVGCDRAMRSQQYSNVRGNGGGGGGGGDACDSSKKGGDSDDKEGSDGDRKERGDDDDRGEKCWLGPRADGVNKEGSISTGHSGRRSTRQDEYNCGEEFGQLVRRLVVKDLRAKIGLTQKEGRSESGEARGSRGSAGVEQNGEEIVSQVIRSLPSFSTTRVHTEAGIFGVGEDKVDDLVAEKEKQEEDGKHPEPSTYVDDECSDTGGATARSQTVGQRWLKSTAAGLRQPEARKTAPKRDLAREPPFTLPSLRKCIIFRDRVGPPRTSAAGRTVKTAGAQILAGQQRTSVGAAAAPVLAGPQNNTGGERAGKPSSENASLTLGTPAGRPQLKVGGVNKPAVTAKTAAAPVANMLAPPFLAGSGSGRADDEREPYAFGRRFASRGAARSEEQQPAPSSRFTFGKVIGAPESSTYGALPVTAVVAQKEKHSSLPGTVAVARKEIKNASPAVVGPAAVPFMGVAGDGGGKGEGLALHASESGCFSPTVVGSAAVPLFEAGGDGGGKGKGPVPHASKPGCCSPGTTQAENRAVSRYIIADGRVVDLLAFTVAPISTAKTSAANKTLAAVASAAEPARPSHHHTSSSEAETLAFSALRSEGETPFSSAVARDTDVGTGPAQGSPAFSAAGDTDVGTTPARGSATQESTTGSDIIRRRAKFVIGRQRVNDSPNLRAMKARLLAKQQEFKRLAAIDNRKFAKEEKRALQHCLTTDMRDHDDGEDADNCNEKNDNVATDDDGGGDSEEVSEVDLEEDRDVPEGDTDDLEEDSNDPKGDSDDLEGDSDD